MRSCFASILLGSALISGGVAFAPRGTAIGSPQDASALPNPSAVVKPHAYVSLDPVPRGEDFQIAVVVEIARGFHMNSHKPTDAYLVPTTLTPQLPTGFQLLNTVYPDGHLQEFSFSPNKPLDVYTGSVTLRLRLWAQPKVRLGATTIPVTLRFQACNDTTCLPPAKVPVSVDLKVGVAGTKARRIHSEIFSTTVSTRQR